MNTEREVNVAVAKMMGGLVALIVIPIAIIATCEATKPCADSVPFPVLGECHSGADLVVEDGAALCRCRR